MALNSLFSVLDNSMFFPLDLILRMHRVNHHKNKFRRQGLFAAVLFYLSIKIWKTCQNFKTFPTCGSSIPRELNRIHFLIGRVHGVATQLRSFDG